MLVWIKFAFNKENKNIKNAKKANNLETVKFKTTLFNKYINKTILEKLVNGFYPLTIFVKELHCRNSAGF